MTDLRWSLAWLVHNTLIHPVVGVLAFLGFARAAERLHDWRAPE